VNVAPSHEKKIKYIFTRREESNPQRNQTSSSKLSTPDPLTPNVDPDPKEGKKNFQKTILYNLLVRSTLTVFLLVSGATKIQSSMSSLVWRQ
jgi:hypothetical protein